MKFEQSLQEKMRPSFLATRIASHQPNIGQRSPLMRSPLVFREITSQTSNSEIGDLVLSEDNDGDADLSEVISASSSDLEKGEKQALEEQKLKDERDAKIAKA